jgi:hypothetical protein
MMSIVDEFTSGAITTRVSRKLYRRHRRAAAARHHDLAPIVALESGVRAEKGILAERCVNGADGIVN